MNLGSLICKADLKVTATFESSDALFSHDSFFDFLGSSRISSVVLESYDVNFFSCG